jgi:hypothetical protein
VDSRRAAGWRGRLGGRLLLSVKHRQAKAASAQREEVTELNLARAVEQLNGLERGPSPPWPTRASG